MKKYRIINNLDAWLGNQPANDETTIIDEAELNRLSQEWEKPIDELMEDLEEIEEGIHMKKVKVYKYINALLDEKLIAEFETNDYDGEEIPDDVIFSQIADIEDIPAENYNDGEFNDYSIYNYYEGCAYPWLHVVISEE